MFIFIFISLGFSNTEAIFLKVVFIIINQLKSLVYSAAADFLKSFYKLIVDIVLNSIDLSNYIIYVDNNVKIFDFSWYLSIVQLIAYSLMAVTIVWEIVKWKSNILPSNEISIGTMTGKIIFSCALVYILPKSVSYIFLKINNAFVKLLLYKSFNLTHDSVNLFIPENSPDLTTLTFTFLLLLFLLAIAFAFLAFIAIYRSIELVICVMIAPIVALSVIRKGDALTVWVLETTAIVFTQSIQIFLLQVLFSIVGSVSSSLTFMYSIVLIALMLKGPTITRKYLYSSGVGGATVGAVGSAGRMVAMKYMFSK